MMRNEKYETSYDLSFVHTLMREIVIKFCRNCFYLTSMAAKVNTIFVSCQILFFAEIRFAISKTLTCGDFSVLDSETTYKLENKGTWPCSIFLNVKNSCTPRLMCNKFDVASANGHLDNNNNNNRKCDFVIYQFNSDENKGFEKNLCSALFVQGKSFLVEFIN